MSYRQAMNLRTMAARYAGTCADQLCRQPIAAGERIGYDPNYRLAYHERCIGDHRGRTVEARPRDEQPIQITQQSEREYGIGRVPADVDPTDEALAEIEAAEIVASFAPPPLRVRRSARRGCRICGATANLMNASLGLACPEHYDELSG